MAAGLLTSVATQAQIQIFEFTGTVEDSHPLIDFQSRLETLPGLEVKAGDSITGSFKVDADQGVHLLPATGAEGMLPTWPVNNRFYFESVTDWSVMVNGREIIGHEQRPGETVVIGGFEGLQEFWQFPLIGGEADSIAFAIPWGGLPLADGFEGSDDFLIGVSLNLTDSLGAAFGDARYPSEVNSEDFDYPKGFIYEWESQTQPHQPLQGILFHIDTLQLVDTVPRPLIRTGLKSHTVEQGDSVLLSVDLQETAGVSLQWSVNGIDLEGETQSSLNLNDLQTSQSGTYMITAKNDIQTNTAMARIQVNAKRHFLEPLALSGWNADVIVEKGGDSASHIQFDGGFGKWFQEGDRGNTPGFPAAGYFTSAADGEIQYRLQPADQNNVLLLTSRDVNPFNDEDRSPEPTGRLQLERPRAFIKLAIAAASGSGGGNGSVVLHFADGSKSRGFTLHAEDWWNRPDRTPVAIGGLHRIYGQPEEEKIQSPDDLGFGLYETVIDLSAEGLDGKVVTEIEFIKPSVSWTTGIFAVSGQSVEARLGAHVTWPVEGSSAFLETAISPDGPWAGFDGEVVVIDDQRVGLVPHGIAARYQRSFPEELESILLFHYDYTNKEEDRIGRSAKMELLNTQFIDGTLFLNGLYANGEDNGFVAKTPVSPMNYRSFSFAVDFKPIDMESVGKQVIIMGGHSTRWMGFEPRGSNLAVTFNNGSRAHVFNDTELTVGAWHRLICSVNLRAGVVRTHLNGRALEDVILGNGFRFDVMGTNREETDKVFTFTNYSSGRAFHGYADNLMIFNRALLDVEMRSIHEALSPKPLTYGGLSDNEVKANLNVSWKSNLIQFEPEISHSLNGSWQPVGHAPINIADRFMLPIDSNQGMGIYRLKRSE